MNLNAYISDDGWWHYRQAMDIVENGHRFNPDKYEFANLNRPLTYPPLFHYTVAYGYKIVKLFIPDIEFIRYTNYFNLAEAFLFILLIYLIADCFVKDKFWSLLSAIGASVSYAITIRARTGELMAFALSDLLALAGLLVLLKSSQRLIKDNQIKQKTNKPTNNVILAKAGIHEKRHAGSGIPAFAGMTNAILAGILFGLSSLCWSAAVWIYFPLPFFLLFAFIICKPIPLKTTYKFFSLVIASMIATALLWQLPLIIKYGINPHNPALKWFMKEFTVMYKVHNWRFYVFSCGVPVLFIPIALLFTIDYFKRKEVFSIFLVFWMLAGVIASLSGWRGHISVIPILSCIITPFTAMKLLPAFDKNKNRLSAQLVFFTILFLSITFIGGKLTAIRTGPLDQANPLECRSNNNSIKMLKFLRENHPNSITADHISFWTSEDAALGKLRMLTGQYLEYLPNKASEVLKDTGKLYLSNEQDAYKIAKKHNIELIIVRRQYFFLDKIGTIFRTAGEPIKDYIVKAIKKTPESPEVSYLFTKKGVQSIMYRMINLHKLENFEMIYDDADRKTNTPANIVVYKVR